MAVKRYIEVHEAIGKVIQHIQVPSGCKPHIIVIAFQDGSELSLDASVSVTAHVRQPRTGRPLTVMTREPS